MQKRSSGFNEVGCCCFVRDSAPSESPNSSCSHTLRAITDPACGNISLSISRANYEVYWHAVSVPTRSCLLPSDPIDAVRRFLSRHRRERRRGKASVVVIWRNSCPLKSQSSFLQGRLLVITKPTTFKDGVGLRLRFTETGEDLTTHSRSKVML